MSYLDELKRAQERAARRDREFSAVVGTLIACAVGFTALLLAIL